MNKKFRYLLPLFVLLASCNTPSTSESTSEGTQGPTVESVLQIINSSLDCTELRDEIRIEKDGVTYCDIFTRLRYDQKNEFFYSYYQENKNSLHEREISFFVIDKDKIRVYLKKGGI